MEKSFACLGPFDVLFAHLPSQLSDSGPVVQKLVIRTRASIPGTHASSQCRGLIKASGFCASCYASSASALLIEQNVKPVVYLGLGHESKSHGVHETETFRRSTKMFLHSLLAGKLEVRARVGSLILW